MKLDGIDIVEGDIEATFRALEEKVAPLLQEKDLLIASSVSETTSFSIDISFDSVGFNAKEEDILDGLFKLFAIGTQELSGFNYHKAKSLFSLATDHLKQNPEESTRLQQALEELKEADIVTDKQKSYLAHNAVDLKNTLSFNRSSFDLNLTSFGKIS